MAAANTSRTNEVLFETSSDPMTKSSTTKAGKSQVGTRPNLTLATCINNRIVRGIGKTFLAIFTVPVMATLEALLGFVAIATLSSIIIVAPVYAKTKIGAFALAITVAPIIGLVLGVTLAFFGAIDGMKRGTLMAYHCSRDTLRNSCSKLKEAYHYVGQAYKEAQQLSHDLANGASIRDAMNVLCKTSS